MTNRFLFPALAAVSACFCQYPPPQAATENAKRISFACNLKAFTPQQKIEHGKLSSRLMTALMHVRERQDGYSLDLDTGKLSLLDTAQWVDLERKCCPFFDFQLELHGQDGSLSLSLMGREGVKQFIEMEFTGLRDKLAHRAGIR